MSAPDNPKPVSANGWIASVLLIIFAYGIYYGYVFPKFNAQDQAMYYRRVKAPNTGAELSLEMKIPKHFSEFQESAATLNLACAPSDTKGCEGSLLVVSFLIDENNHAILQQNVTLRRLDSEDFPPVVRNLPIEYSLKTNEVLSIPVSVLLPSREGDAVVFLVFINGKEKPVEWNTGTSDIKACKGKEESDRICAGINYSETLKQSAVKYLLFPPWSNRILPFIAFAMVWLAEQVLPNKETWNASPNKYAVAFTLFGGWFLFLLYSVLYFALLTDQWFISALFALFFTSCIITLPKLLASVKKYSYLVMLSHLLFALPIAVWIFFPNSQVGEVQNTQELKAVMDLGLAVLAILLFASLYHLFGSDGLKKRLLHILIFLPFVLFILFHNQDVMKALPILPWVGIAIPLFLLIAILAYLFWMRDVMKDTVKQLTSVRKKVVLFVEKHHHDRLKWIEGEVLQKKGKKEENEELANWWFRLGANRYDNLLWRAAYYICKVSLTDAADLRSKVILPRQEELANLKKQQYQEKIAQKKDGLQDKPEDAANAHPSTENLSDGEGTQPPPPETPKHDPGAGAEGEAPLPENIV